MKKKIWNGIGLFRSNSHSPTKKEQEISCTSTSTTSELNCSGASKANTESPRNEIEIQSQGQVPLSFAINWQTEDTTQLSVQPPPSPSKGSLRTNWASSLTKKGGNSPPVGILNRSTKLWCQTLSLLLKQLATKLKVIILQFAENEDIHTSLWELWEFIGSMEDKILENSGGAENYTLGIYFASSTGVKVSEELSLPSLIVNFITNLRIYLVKEELQSILKSGNPTQCYDISCHGKEIGRSNTNNNTDAIGVTDCTFKQQVLCLFQYLNEMMQNSVLMEKFPCELPNLVQLSAHDYPPSALFIREAAIYTVTSAANELFSIRYVHFLHDTKLVTDTLQLIMDNRVAIVVSSKFKAQQAMQQHIHQAEKKLSQETYIDPILTANAVEDALGLRKTTSECSNVVRRMSWTVGSPSEIENDVDSSPDQRRKSLSAELTDYAERNYCLITYDVMIGLNTLIHIIQQSSCHSLVLMEEFEFAGGYKFFENFIKTCPLDAISNVLSLLNLLLPLGTGFSWNPSKIDDFCVATVATCGARNIPCFVLIRDLLLNSITALEIQSDLPKNLYVHRNTQVDIAPDDHYSVYCKRHESLVEQLLLIVLHVYTSDFENFERLEESTQTLTLILTKLQWIGSDDAQEIVLRIVEFVCAAPVVKSMQSLDVLSILCSLFMEAAATELRDIMHQSLSLTCIDNREEQGKDGIIYASQPNKTSSRSRRICAPFSVLTGRCLIKIVDTSNIDFKYKYDLCEFGVLRKGIYPLLEELSAILQDTNIANDKKRQIMLPLLSTLNTWSELLANILKNELLISIEFRELRISEHIYVIGKFVILENLIETNDLVEHYERLSSVYKVLVVLSSFDETAYKKSMQLRDLQGSVISGSIKQDEDADRSKIEFLQSGVDDDITRMLALLAACHGDEHLQHQTIVILSFMLSESPFGCQSWLHCHGQQKLEAVFSTLGQALNIDGRDIVSFRLLYSILDLMSSTYCTIRNPHQNLTENRAEVHINYTSIASSIQRSGILSAKSQLKVLILHILQFITGQKKSYKEMLKFGPIQFFEPVELLILLLPRLPSEEGAIVLDYLLDQLSQCDNAFIFSHTKNQTTMGLINAGALNWILQGEMIEIYCNNYHPLHIRLYQLLLLLSTHQFSTAHFRTLLKVAAQGMPNLLANVNKYKNFPLLQLINPPPNGIEQLEVGMRFIRELSQRAFIPHTKVGQFDSKLPNTGYIHIMTDKVAWPPPSGYSFSCWIQMLPRRQDISFRSHNVNNALQSYGLDQHKNNSFDSTKSMDLETGKSSASESVVYAALCEGPIKITIDEMQKQKQKSSGDRKFKRGAQVGRYAVWVAPTLTLFASKSNANREKPVAVEVNSVTQTGPLTFALGSGGMRFLAECDSESEMKMWMNAMNAYMLKQSEQLPRDEGKYRTHNNFNSENQRTNNGYICLLSVYSMEHPGCFTAIYFEQESGCLRVDTGSVGSGSNMLASPSKHNSVLFKNVNMELLQPLMTETDPQDSVADWHHIAFTHRRAVMGKSLLSLFIDGAEVATKKLSFPSAPSQSSSIQAFIGKDIKICGSNSALPWLLGPAWFTDEVLTSKSLVCMFLQGPSYTGQFSGHDYWSVGDHADVLAAIQLDRTAQRFVEVSRVAKRLNLTRLGQASRPFRIEKANTSTFQGISLISSNLPDTTMKLGKTPSYDVSSASISAFDTPNRISMNTFGFPQKELVWIEAFRQFIKKDCAMDYFGSEILNTLTTFKLPDDSVIFSVNTCRSSTKVITSAKLEGTPNSMSQMQFVGTEPDVPLDISSAIPSVGGLRSVIFPLLANAERAIDIATIVDIMILCIRRSRLCMAECIDINGFTLMTGIICRRPTLLTPEVLDALLRASIAGSKNATIHKFSKKIKAQFNHTLIVDATALSQIALNKELYQCCGRVQQLQIIEALNTTVKYDNPNAIFNARQLRRQDFIMWLLLNLSTICEDDGMEYDTTQSLVNLRLRECYPKHCDVVSNSLLHEIIKLIRTYLSIESHIDDIGVIVDCLQASLRSGSLGTKCSPIRLVILQLMLHETEIPHSKAANTGEVEKRSLLAYQAQNGQPTLVQNMICSVLYHPQYDSQNSNAVPQNLAQDSPSDRSSNNSKQHLPVFADEPSTYMYGLDTVLIQIIQQDSAVTGNEVVEVLLALRILMSMAQIDPHFAHHLFTTPGIYDALFQGLQKYSTNCDIYIPLLAYISGIQIKDTPYVDMQVRDSSRHQQFALPTPFAAAPYMGLYSPTLIRSHTSAKLNALGKFSNNNSATTPPYIENVWTLLSSLILWNCQVATNSARSISAIVINQITFHTEISEAFLSCLCESKSVVLKVIVTWIRSFSDPIEIVKDSFHSKNDIKSSVHTNLFSDTDMDMFSELRGETTNKTKSNFQLALAWIINNRAPQHEEPSSVAVASLECLKLMLSRTLFEREDFADIMIIFLEYLDISSTQMNSMIDGQSCWLTYLVHIIKSTKALSVHTSVRVLRNISTLALSICKYLLKPPKHSNVLSEEKKSQSHCFGTNMLFFLFSILRLCITTTHIFDVVGADEHNFFYGVIVHATQTIVLLELDEHIHCENPQIPLLDCLLTSKHLLFQQVKCSSIIVCSSTIEDAATPSDEVSGPMPETQSSTISAATTTNALTNTLHRMRLLSMQKEFGVGHESDRSFVLCLSAKLFRLLQAESERVRHCAILLWQFLIRQKMNILRELFIVEPKSSLLQSMTNSSTKKEVIDVYNCGFDRLLKVIPYEIDRHDRIGQFRTNDHEKEVGDRAENYEQWLLFHNWLSDNAEMLQEMIVIRTEPIRQHLLDVLHSIIGVRKFNLTISPPLVSQRSPIDSTLELYIHSDFNPDVTISPALESTYPIQHSCLQINYQAIQRYLMKIQNNYFSQLELMDEALEQWRGNYLSHLHTRPFWIAPKSSSNYNAKREDGGVIYQLDFTEGPMRMRVRLIPIIESEKSEHIFLKNIEYQSKVILEELRDSSVSNTHRDQVMLISALETIQVYQKYTQLYVESLTKDDVQACKNALDTLILSCNHVPTKKILRTYLAAENSLNPRDIAFKFMSIYFPLKSETESSRFPSVDIDGNLIQTVRELLTENSGFNNHMEHIFDEIEAACKLKLTHATSGVPINFLHSEFLSIGEEDWGEDTDQNEHYKSYSSADNFVGNEDTTLRNVISIGYNNTEKDCCNYQDFDIIINKDILCEINKQPSTPISLQTNIMSTNNDLNDDKILLSNSSGTFNNSAGDEYIDKAQDSLMQSNTPTYDNAFVALERFLNPKEYPPDPTRCFDAEYVAGVKKTLGLFIIGRDAIYFIGGYAKSFQSDSYTAKIAADSQNKLDKSNHKNFMPRSVKSSRRITQQLKSHSSQFTVAPLREVINSPSSFKRWSIMYNNVKQFFRIKYQLRPVAVEIFDTDGATHFVHFNSYREREKVLKLLFSMPMPNSVFWNPIFHSSGLPSNLSFASSMKRVREVWTKKWTRGMISNFEYIMHLNTIAGRSFNDLTQYPVFPWVIADYESDFLDLSNPATFRDLSKPMGALGSKRAKQFVERFSALQQSINEQKKTNNHSDFTPDSHPFHYGTHYSCSAYVINFLIRLQPFTKLAKDLQGGNFDHADRLFQSIRASWLSASSENLQDVQELIPEFYFLPEFLQNLNNLDLGTTQRGECVGDVVLPPWAHGDAREFIRLQRCALESSYVSEHLHHWIDLIFGYKQRGKYAEQALNVFMHTTYEGSIDIDSITDQVIRRSTISQIENFGQTPSQLFTNPHIARRIPTIPSHPAVNSTPLADKDNALTDLSFTSATGQVEELKQFDTTNISVVSICDDETVARQHSANSIASHNNYLDAFIKWHMPLAPPLVVIGTKYVMLKKKYSMNYTEPVGDLSLSSQDQIQVCPLGCILLPPKYNKIADWRQNVVNRTSQNSDYTSGMLYLRRNQKPGKILNTIEGLHQSKITCAKFCELGNILLTGGEDAVVNICYVKKATGGGRIFRQCAKLTGHGDRITAIAFEKLFNLVVSGSADKSVILWDFRSHKYIRELLGHTAPILNVSINGSNGNIISTTTHDIKLWSINGSLLASISTILASGLAPISTAISTRCDIWQNGVVAVTGHENGTITLWGLMYPSEIALEKKKRNSTQQPFQNNVSSSTKAYHLYAMKFLLDHRSPVTALAISKSQRQLVSSDAEGICIQWVDEINGQQPIPPQ